MRGLCYHLLLTCRQQKSRRFLVDNMLFIDFISGYLTLYISYVIVAVPRLLGEYAEKDNRIVRHLATEVASVVPLMTKSATLLAYREDNTMPCSPHPLFVFPSQQSMKPVIVVVGCLH